MVYLINAEAGPTKKNNGMKTVDMAWDIFLRKNDLAISYERFSIRLHDTSIQVTNKIKLDYQGSLDFNFDALNHDDILVYWGDFLHAQHYHQKDLHKLTKKPKSLSRRFIKSMFFRDKNIKLDKESYIPYVQNFYLPNCKQKRWKETISFGTTLVGDNDFDIFSQEEYQQSFYSFINGLDRMWTRDVMSATQVSHIRNDYQCNYLGIDAALLVDTKDYEAVLDEPTFEIPKPEYILTHFARSEEDINKLMNFTVSLKEEMNMPLYWIPWLNPLNHERFASLEASLKKSVEDINTESYSDIIHLLKNAKLVITDTYHLTLIAWRLGIPVVCLGAGLQYPMSTVDDKKKEVFYMMHNMLPFYFFTEQLDDNERVEEFIQFTKKELENGRAINNIVDKIKHQAESVEKDLANYFRTALNLTEK
ncbi:MAG: polysaccharide pyruvyl transferase family protein [Sulfurimonas sp.]